MIGSACTEGGGESNEVVILEAMVEAIEGF